MNTYLVFTTVTGINKAPDMERAVAPKVTDCNAVRFPFTPNSFFNQLNEEKYRPTPGTQRAIDWNQII